MKENKSGRYGLSERKEVRDVRTRNDVGEVRTRNYITVYMYILEK